MADQARELVVLTRGADHELSSVGVTIANGDMTAGLTMSIFSSAPRWIRSASRAADTTQVNPLDPLKALIGDFPGRGGTPWARTPCVTARGYTQEYLIQSVVMAGSSVVHERLGAATLSF
jgi:hypothetical protein